MIVDLVARIGVWFVSRCQDVRALHLRLTISRSLHLLYLLPVYNKLVLIRKLIELEVVCLLKLLAACVIQMNHRKVFRQNRLDLLRTCDVFGSLTRVVANGQALLTEGRQQLDQAVDLSEFLLVGSDVDFLFMDLDQNMERGVTDVVFNVAIDLLKDQFFDHLVLKADACQMNNRVPRLRAG